MIAEHQPQRLMQEMCRRMVGPHGTAPAMINTEFQCCTNLQRAGGDRDCMDEQIAKLSARKKTIDAQMADPAIYDDANKDKLKDLVIDQAYVAKELDQLEAEWLEKQAQLESLQAAA